MNGIVVFYIRRIALPIVTSTEQDGLDNLHLDGLYNVDQGSDRHVERTEFRITKAQKDGEGQHKDDDFKAFEVGVWWHCHTSDTVIMF